MGAASASVRTTRRVVFGATSRYDHPGPWGWCEGQEGVICLTASQILGPDAENISQLWCWWFRQITPQGWWGETRPFSGQKFSFPGRETKAWWVRSSHKVCSISRSLILNLASSPRLASFQSLLTESQTSLFPGQKWGSRIPLSPWFPPPPLISTWNLVSMVDHNEPPLEPSPSLYVWSGWDKDTGFSWRSISFHYYPFRFWSVLALFF